MAEQLDKTVLTRLAWLTELRRQGHRQCVGGQTGAFKNSSDATVCAVRLAFEMIPAEARDAHDSIVVVVAKATGLSYAQAATVLMLNDGRREWWVDGEDVFLSPQFEVRPHTFAEIADVIEGWGK